MLHSVSSTGVFRVTQPSAHGLFCNEASSGEEGRGQSVQVAVAQGKGEVSILDKISSLLLHRINIVGINHPIIHPCLES